MEFQDGFPNYETLAQHSDADGVIVRKKLMNVFWLLLGVTLIEVCIGWFWHDIHERTHISKTLLIIVFIMFTLLKAGYIVMTFMHLGDESKWMRWMILGPYFIFAVYLIYMTTVTEGTYSLGGRNILSPATQHPSSAPPTSAPAHEE